MTASSSTRNHGLGYREITLAGLRDFAVSQSCHLAAKLGLVCLVIRVFQGLRFMGSRGFMALGFRRQNIGFGFVGWV